MPGIRRRRSRCAAMSKSCASCRRILRIRGELRNRLIADPPDLFIGVDAPDFNLGLEAALKARRIQPCTT